MKNSNIRYIVVIIAQLLVCWPSIAQFKVSKQEFIGLDVSDKISYYENLNDSLKKVNSVFLKNNFNDLRKENVNTATAKKIDLIIAQLNYLSGNYIQSVNQYNAVLTTKQYELTQQDSMFVYDELKKSYYRLYLYPEIFEVNAIIQQLISNGAEYPLWSYNMNSKLFAELKQYEKAVSALQEEINTLKQTKNRDSLIIPSAYNDLGYYYFEIKNIDSALVNFKRSLAYADKSLKPVNQDSYEQLVAVVKGNIAGVYIEKKKYKDAIVLLQEDVEVGMRTKLNLLSTFYSYNLLINCYLELKDYDKAEKVIAEAEQYIPLLTNKTPIVYFYINKSKLFENINEIDSSNFYLKKAYKIKDYLLTKGMNDILASNELIHDFNEKLRIRERHQVALKSQEVQLKNKQRNVFMFFTLLFLLLLGLSLYAVYKLQNKKRELSNKSIEISQKNQEVKQALMEKEVLLKEVHHRVKNNLQVISGLLELQNITISDEVVKQALKEGQNRIQSVALVHKMMYQSESVSKVNMEKYLKELMQVLETSYAKVNKKITTIVSAPDIDLDVTLAVPLSLIVNEAVCNAYKHAFVNTNTGKITVAMINVNKNGQEYQLTIKDNGVGLPEKFNIKKLKSIGFDLIKGLTKQLKGTVQVHNNNGTEIVISFVNNEFV